MSEKRIVQWVVGVEGVFYALTGLAMIAAPRWFYENIGDFPPFNRHYTGDLGTFTLALGVGLLIAARNPYRQRLLIGVAILASAMHTLNHIYDAVIAAEPLAYWLIDVGPLVLFAALLVLVYPKPRTAEE